MSISYIGWSEPKNKSNLDSVYNYKQSPVILIFCMNAHVFNKGVGWSKTSITCVLLRSSNGNTLWKNSIKFECTDITVLHMRKKSLRNDTVSPLVVKYNCYHWTEHGLTLIFCTQTTG